MKRMIVFLLLISNAIVAMEPQGCTWRGDGKVEFNNKVKEQEKGINGWVAKDGVKIVSYHYTYNDFYQRGYDLQWSSKESFKSPGTFYVDFRRDVYGEPWTSPFARHVAQIPDKNDDELSWLRKLYDRKSDDLKIYGSKTLMIARSDSFAYVWDRVKKAQTALLIHDFGCINSLYLDKNSERIMTASDDGQIRFSDKTGKILLGVDLKKPIYSAYVDDENAEIIVVTKDGCDFYILVQEYLDDFHNGLKT